MSEVKPEKTLINQLKKRSGEFTVNAMEIVKENPEVQRLVLGNMVRLSDAKEVVDGLAKQLDDKKKLSLQEERNQFWFGYRSALREVKQLLGVSLPQQKTEENKQ